MCPPSSSGVNTNTSTNTLLFLWFVWHHQDECSSQIFSWLAHLKLDNTACCVNSGSTSTSIHEEVQESTDQPLGLVIDGCTLMYALDKSLSAKFLKLTSHCQVVLCCRATPIQKVSIAFIRTCFSNVAVLHGKVTHGIRLRFKISIKFEGKSEKFRRRDLKLRENQKQLYPHPCCMRVDQTYQPTGH